MKLSDLLEGDVIDFGAHRKEKAFMDKVGAMSKSNSADEIAYDIEAAEGRDAELAQDVKRKYGRQIKDLHTFLNRPVMSGGFKNANAVTDALSAWLPRKKHSRAIDNVVSDENFWNEVRRHNAIWRAVTNHYPMEVIWALPDVDDFDDIEQLYQMLSKARQHYEKGSR